MSIQILFEFSKIIKIIEKNYFYRKKEMARFSR